LIKELTKGENMQKFNKAAILVATAVAGLVLAGCGGGGTASGPLKIGSLLPETGSLAFLGPPEFAGVDLAVADINARWSTWRKY
jgi:branched-chain amino acid transport system substrate-binding protein